MAGSTERNFLFAMLNAVNKDQSTMQWQEQTDSNSTILDANIENTYYKAWNSVLQKDAAAVKSNANPSTEDQYTADSTTAQTQESMCDGATQASQQTVGQDGSNLQNQAQLASTLNSVASNVASLIGHAY